MGGLQKKLQGIHSTQRKGVFSTYNIMWLISPLMYNYTENQAEV